ncbi:heterodimeric complex [Teratosphaeria destructans]|uniref:Heterodimeric complex n=1 Tax=Teratosphaeria destructans TaxID=418781 RepID=A0A9W7SXM1_9PEZI|nr:heterodimeric complex [Teratosphaeria destructans]
MRRSTNVRLYVRQQPQQALVTLDTKEKGRKPVDPPPIIEMHVARSADPTENWLVSPYFFVIAVLLEGEHGDNIVSGKELIGTSSSSLHKLKDINNHDGGFFIFGDLSIKRTGVHRLRFNLFDSNAAEGAHFITSIDSEPFEVVTSKDFRGLQESTHLSRTFSDQGVRLRLRKEAKQISGQRKGAHASPDRSQRNAYQTAQSAQYNAYADFDDSRSPYPSAKRQRQDSSTYRAGSTAQSLYGQGVTPGRAYAVQSHRPMQEHGYGFQAPGMNGQIQPVQQSAVSGISYQFGSGMTAPRVSWDSFNEYRQPRYSGTMTPTALTDPYTTLGASNASLAGDYSAPGGSVGGSQAPFGLQNFQDQSAQHQSFGSDFVQSTTPAQPGQEYTYAGSAHSAHSSFAENRAITSTTPVDPYGEATAGSSAGPSDPTLSQLQYPSRTPNTQTGMAALPTLSSPYAGVPYDYSQQ